jgi:hypothetical protein
VNDLPSEALPITLRTAVAFLSMAVLKTFDTDLVDQFLERPKTLRDGLPEWQKSAWSGEMTAIWILRDDLEVEVGQIRFKYPRNSNISPGLSLILRGNAIWRVDLVPEDECKFNPHDAHVFGLPPRVCGPHEHCWADNRDYVRSNGFTKIPYRRPLTPQLRHFGQILPWLASRITLELTPEQRKFDKPPQSDLFERR